VTSIELYLARDVDVHSSLQPMTLWNSHTAH
jgi:hypothetical protein